MKAMENEKGRPGCVKGVWCNYHNKENNMEKNMEKNKGELDGNPRSLHKGCRDAQGGRGVLPQGI